jgi:hypothetical protein
MVYRETATGERGYGQRLPEDIVLLARTPRYTLRVKAPGNPHPWYQLRGR